MPPDSLNWWFLAWLAVVLATAKWFLSAAQAAAAAQQQFPGGRGCGKIFWSKKFEHPQAAGMDSSCCCHCLTDSLTHRPSATGGPCQHLLKCLQKDCCCKIGEAKKTFQAKQSFDWKVMICSGDFPPKRLFQRRHNFEWCSYEIYVHARLIFSCILHKIQQLEQFSVFTQFDISPWLSSWEKELFSGVV